MNAEQKITQGMKREKRTIEAWNICQCGRILHSISEAERGTCASCWIKTMPTDTRKALNRLIACAFNGADEKDKDAAIIDSIDKLNRDKIRQCGE